MTAPNAPMSAAEVLAILNRMRVQAFVGRCHDSNVFSAELIQHRDEDRAAITAVAAMAEREAALIAERDGFKSAWWDVVEMLGGKKLTDISNAQYHASVLAPKIRELIALSAERDALIKEVEALRGLVAAGKRAIGDHNAPGDCCATGPMTGDPYKDLVECPACAFLAMAAHAEDGR